MRERTRLGEKRESREKFIVGHSEGKESGARIAEYTRQRQFKCAIKKNVERRRTQSAS